MTNKEKFIQIIQEKLPEAKAKPLLTWLEKDTDFFTAPASARYHGAYEGGLLEHSLNVYKRLRELVALHGFESEILQESVAVAALCHDVCKTNFYKKGYRNVKNDATGQWEKKEVYEYDDQIPLGHGEKSVILLQRIIPLSMDEVYAIRWHMGGFDNAVKGGERASSSAYEKCKLAILLHLADMTATYLDEVR